MYRLLFLMCSVCSIYGMVPAQTSQPPIYLAVYNTPTSHATSASTPQFTSTQQVVQTSQQVATMPALDMARNALSAVPASIHSLYDFLWDHKWSTIGVTVLGMYSSLLAYFYTSKQFVYQTNVWARWQNQHSLSDLCIKPLAELQKELIFAIHGRYVNTANPTDYITPLCSFLRDINEEEKRLKVFCFRAGLVSKIPFLGKILPHSVQAVHEAELLVDRLAFIKHIFLSWAAECNWLQIEHVCQKSH